MAARIVVALDRNDTVIVAQAEEAENQDMLKEVVDGSAPLVRLAATLSNMNRQWRSTNTIKVARPRHGWAADGIRRTKNIGIRASRGELIPMVKHRDIER